MDDSGGVLRLRWPGHADQRYRLQVSPAVDFGQLLVDQELELGLRTMAVPLKNFRGEVVAAMNISVHAARMSLEQMVSMM